MVKYAALLIIPFMLMGCASEDVIDTPVAQTDNITQKSTLLSEIEQLTNDNASLVEENTALHELIYIKSQEYLALKATSKQAIKQYNGILVDAANLRNQNGNLITELAGYNSLKQSYIRVQAQSAMYETAMVEVTDLKAQLLSANVTITALQEQIEDGG